MKMMCDTIPVIVLIVGTCLHEAFSAPSLVSRSLLDETESVNSTETKPGASFALTYLRKYGYLESSDSNSSETLYSEAKVSDAIKTMQKYGGIPETGRLDDTTLTLLHKPRCGVKDIDHSRSKRYVYGSKGWNKRHLTYRIENWSSKMDYNDVIRDIRKAFDVWGEYTHLQFSNKTSDSVDIAISFSSGNHGDSYPFDGIGGTLAHAFYPQNYPGRSGDVHFDEEEPWYSPSSSSISEEDKSRGISFLDVAVHELGHSLGLAHSPVQTSVMFPYYRSSNSQEPKLDYDDIMGMYHLYITRNIEDAPDSASTTKGPEAPEPTTPRRRYSSTTTERNRWETTRRPWTTSSIPSTTTSRTELNPSSPLPDLCTDGFDSISLLRGEIFVFKGQYMWRFIRRGQVAPGGYPTKTSRLFPLLDNLPRIDAAFERETDGKIVFISGKSYWTFDGTPEGNSGPHPLTDFDLPSTIQNLDGAFVWDKNKMLYFFKNNEYWKYNTSTNKMDKGYPKSIGNWRGLPTDRISSVFRYKDGKTYFFKDSEFWRFDDADVRTEDGYPLTASNHWFNC